MLHENILHLCKENGTTFAEVERELGFGKGTIRRWGEHSPSIDKVKAVADYFGVTVNDLLRGSITQAVKSQNACSFTN